MPYNGKSAALPKNSFKIEYTSRNGSINVLNQFLVIGDTTVHLIYRGTKDETKIITNGIQQRERGLILMVMRTDKGPDTYYLGKKVQIIGIIKEYKGSPEIIVKTPDQNTQLGHH